MSDTRRPPNEMMPAAAVPLEPTPVVGLKDIDEAPAIEALPLDAWHRVRGGRMVAFAGYHMPIQYEGIMAEHLWTREQAGLFDVSHMGQLVLSGEGAAAALEAVLPGDVAGLGEWYEPVSMPACDGRNILIVNSIHVPGNSRAELQQEIGKAIMHDNELKYTIPGKCSSLRAQIDGQDIYPIYYDFGDDQQAMCEAKAVHGGNGRTLNNSGDFSDPC